VTVQAIRDLQQRRLFLGKLNQFGIMKTTKKKKEKRKNIKDNKNINNIKNSWNVCYLESEREFRAIYE